MNRDKKVIRIGIAGLGTVGTGVFRLLKSEKKRLLESYGVEFKIKTIAVKNVKKSRAVSLRGIQLTQDLNQISNDPEIELVLELMGGIDVASKFLENCIKAGKHVVTANKALLAEKGQSLYRILAKSNSRIGYEASVGGGIPVLRGIEQGLMSNSVDRVYGILNGTSNYILTEMSQSRKAYDEILEDAKEKGYAELDPTLDINGADAAHKLAVLARLAFKQEIDFRKISFEGIEQITSDDIHYALELGYAIKLLAVAKKQQDEVELRVHPALIHSSHLLAHVNGVNNAVMVRGNGVGEALFYGKGAGEAPTASAVVNDMIGIAMEEPATRKNDVYNSAKICQMNHIQSRYYLRFVVKDEPGVMGNLNRILGDHGISLASIHQKETNSSSVPVVLLTHPTLEKDLSKAVKEISKLKFMKGLPTCLRVESLNEG